MWEWEEKEEEGRGRGEGEMRRYETPPASVSASHSPEPPRETHGEKVQVDEPVPKNVRNVEADTRALAVARRNGGSTRNAGPSPV